MYFWGVNRRRGQNRAIKPIRGDLMTLCRFCGSRHLWKYGLRKIKRGTFQKFRCKSCGRQFIDDDFLGMQTPKEVVASALRWRRHGFSRQIVSREIMSVYKIERHETAVQYWEKRFAALFMSLNRAVLFALGALLFFDHTELKISGKKAYFYALRCAVLGVIVGWFLGCTKEQRSADECLRNGQRRMSPVYWPEKIVTDGEAALRAAVNKVFSHRVKHYRYKGFKDKTNNNSVEQMFRFKKRVPEFRSFAQAKCFFEMFVYSYNSEHGHGSPVEEVLNTASFLAHFMENFFIQAL